MPLGDEDDIDADEFPDGEDCFMIDDLNISGMGPVDPTCSKYEALYNDAKHRNMRQEYIYSKCIDKECTFKPDLITKKSKISINTVKEVQEQVRHKSVEKAAYQSEQRDADSVKPTKPAVGGVPPQNMHPNTRLAYLHDRATSNEDEVFKRLTEQAAICRNIALQKQ
jgi:hypothetical protein